jgi:bifunctional DNA-binding transcriptional regulator/antitoxin component of YhaV-PrlF toxin-antitoxin module
MLKHHRARRQGRSWSIPPPFYANARRTLAGRIWRHSLMKMIHTPDVPHFVKRARSLRIGPQGRAVIPAEIRTALDVGPGNAVVAWVEGDRLVLRSRAAVEEELWSRFSGVEGNLADALISERREEAWREVEEVEPRCVLDAPAVLARPCRPGFRRWSGSPSLRKTPRPSPRSVLEPRSWACPWAIEPASPWRGGSRSRRSRQTVPGRGYGISVYS